MSERDYLERTIETVRNHRDAENCWPQWANIFADEIERLWSLEEQHETATDELSARDQEVTTLTGAYHMLEEQVQTARQEADDAEIALHRVEKWRAETSTQLTQVCSERDRAIEQLEATEQHANEICQLAHRQGETIYDMTIQLASLRHALTQVRAECDLPDYIAEFIGEALGSSEEARDVRA